MLNPKQMEAVDKAIDKENQRTIEYNFLNSIVKYGMDINIDMRLLPIYTLLGKEIIKILSELKKTNITDKQFCTARDIIMKPHAEMATAIINFHIFIKEKIKEKGEIKNGKNK